MIGVCLESIGGGDCFECTYLGFFGVRDWGSGELTASVNTGGLDCEGWDSDRTSDLGV